MDDLFSGIKTAMSLMGMEFQDISPEDKAEIDQYLADEKYDFLDRYTTPFSQFDGKLAYAMMKISALPTGREILAKKLIGLPLASIDSKMAEAVSSVEELMKSVVAKRAEVKEAEAEKQEAEAEVKDEKTEEAEPKKFDMADYWDQLVSAEKNSELEAEVQPFVDLIQSVTKDLQTARSERFTEMLTAMSPPRRQEPEYPGLSKGPGGKILNSLFNSLFSSNNIQEILKDKFTESDNSSPPADSTD